MVALDEPMPCPRIEAGDNALQASAGELPYVFLLVADNMLFSDYQNWVHPNLGKHLDCGITEDVKFQDRLKTRLYANPELRRTV